MPGPPSIRAAQYLRMSTEHQRYSLANQAEAIGEYAAARGYELARSYVDPARSGLTIEGRPGLQALLRDVLAPDCDFAAILVLDVSRWGRFQDHDEAAHYEFVCRSAGVPVIYCAEPFENDQSAISSLMKLLKRLMAAEFSRDLATKVKQAQIRRVRLGLHPCGRAMYGVRRVALDRAGGVRQVLGPRERKVFAEDHVVLRPGPVEELRVIRRIFRRFVHDDCSVSVIARELNREHIPSATGRPWTRYLVDGVLRNELMMGVRVFNRTTQPLRAKASPRPREEWIRVKLFPPIAPPKLFRAAKAKLSGHNRLSKAAMLRALRKIQRRHGRLSAALVNGSPEAPSTSSYARHFGSLRNAYAEVGYADPGSADHQLQLRQRLIERLRAAHSRHGYLTEQRIDADPDLACGATYRRHFGSLRRAYELAGLPFTSAQLRDAASARWAARRAAGKACGRARQDDAALLASLRQMYAERGYVSACALRTDATFPNPALLRYRFGSLLAAYARAGIPGDQQELQRAGVRRRRATSSPPRPGAGDER
jgi:DNA invertase Pin-like site-specific DNA recombinase